jgi:hypothetical protein
MQVVCQPENIAVVAICAASLRLFTGFAEVNLAADM